MICRGSAGLNFLNRCADVANIAQSAVRILLKTPLQQVAHPGRDFCGQGMPVRLMFEHGCNSVRHALAFEGAFSGDQLV
jgi:hypothetical protein